VALLARSVAEGPGRPVALHPVDTGPCFGPSGCATGAGNPAAPTCREFLLRAAAP
jgi:hypothetical protein